MIERTASEIITINVNGRRKQITKLEAAAIQISNKSASGDLKATKLMFDLLRSGEEKTPEEADKPLLNADDRAIISRMLARYDRKSK